MSTIQNHLLSKPPAFVHPKDKPDVAKTANCVYEIMYTQNYTAPEVIMLYYVSTRLKFIKSWVLMLQWINKFPNDINRKHIKVLRYYKTANFNKRTLH